MTGSRPTRPGSPGEGSGSSGGGIRGGTGRGILLAVAVPLLLFAAAARRVPLTIIGLTQYLTPILQLLIGVLLLHEALPPAQFAGFVLVWVALIILSVDMFRNAVRGRSRQILEPID